MGKNTPRNYSVIEQALTSETSRYIAGIIGAFLSLQYAAETAKWYEKIFMSATGIAAASYLAPAVQEYLHLNNEYTLGLAFVLGMYGWSITGGVFKFIKSDALKNAILNKIGGKEWTA